MKLAALLLILFAAHALAAAPSELLRALTDRMQSQAARNAMLVQQMEGRILVPSTSPYLGRAVADPERLPFYRSLGHVQFSDGFKAHVVHHALDGAGTARLVVLVHGIVRGDTSGWQVASDTPVEVSAGTVFVGSDFGRTVCRVGGAGEALAFGFMRPGAGGFEADGKAVVVYELDPHSNPIPMTGFRAICRS
jgi:hypothetical protein